MNRVHPAKDQLVFPSRTWENSVAIISETELSVPLFRVEAIAFEEVDLRVRVSNRQVALACMAQSAFR